MQSGLTRLHEVSLKAQKKSQERKQIKQDPEPFQEPSRAHLCWIIYAMARSEHGAAPASRPGGGARDPMLDPMMEALDRALAENPLTEQQVPMTSAPVARAGIRVRWTLPTVEKARAIITAFRDIYVNNSVLGCDGWDRHARVLNQALGLPVTEENGHAIGELLEVDLTHLVPSEGAVLSPEQVSEGITTEMDRKDEQRMWEQGHSFDDRSEAELMWDTMAYTVAEFVTTEDQEGAKTEMHQKFDEHQQREKDRMDAFALARTTAGTDRPGVSASSDGCNS